METRIVFYSFRTSDTVKTGQEQLQHSKDNALRYRHYGSFFYRTPLIPMEKDKVIKSYIFPQN